ncbi:hypothetical protein LN042_30920 [Kitasatospora sp. RB6PN24]|uniref:hypothetical protein n=1 Tax=Kitasatospora humi TaxID=2893891 RepID=UPI001E3DA4DB|nr:hypothetical protein [Kitasatospora humi]MCC9311424.1 hypothetical protein [Kitasatospora humi]
MTKDQSAIASATSAVTAAVHADDLAALYRAVMPPDGSATPPDQAATWFATLVIRLALAAAAASELERGCSREAVSGWIEQVLGPPPTPALLRAQDPGRIDHVEAVRAAAEHGRCREYAVDLVRLGLTEPEDAVDERGAAALSAVTGDKQRQITVIQMLGRLAPDPGRRF